MSSNDKIKLKGVDNNKTYVGDTHYYLPLDSERMIAFNKDQVVYDQKRDSYYSYLQDKQGRLYEVDLGKTQQKVDEPKEETRGRGLTPSWLVPVLIGASAVAIVGSAGLLAPEIGLADAGLLATEGGIEMSEISSLGAVSPLAEIGGESAEIGTSAVAEDSSITGTQALAIASGATGTGGLISSGVIASGIGKKDPEDNQKGRDRDRESKEDQPEEQPQKPKYDGEGPKNIPMTPGKLVPGGLVEDGSGKFLIKDSDTDAHQFYTPTGYSFHNNAGRKIMVNTKTGESFDITDKYYRMSYIVKPQQIQEVQQYDSDRMLGDFLKGPDRVQPETQPEKEPEKQPEKEPEKQPDDPQPTPEKQPTPDPQPIKPRPRPIDPRKPDRDDPIPPDTDNHGDLPIYHPGIDLKPKTIIECPIIGVQFF